MAESVVSNVAARLGELVIQEAIFLRGVENEVNRLRTELGRMKSFLKEADSRQAEDERVRNWVAEIRDIAYDAEDVIETFALKIASRRTGGFSNVIKRSACFLKEGRMLHKVRSEIEQIMNKITDLTRSLQTYGIKGLSERASSSTSSSSSRRQQLRQSYAHTVEATVVGLDEDIKELASVLVDEGRHFRVASICGMGGLGKTTLAKKVYHHSQVRNHFKYFVWAYISQQCQRKAVWKGILSSLGLHHDKGGFLNLEDDQELAEKLYDFLREKKCLVVLDDIWSPQDWDMIKAAFPMEENAASGGSKILLTSRNKDLALYADSRGYLHELKCLTDEDGWKLFQRITFPRSDSADYIIEEKMEELGKNMVKQCAGLPLAIVVLGGILATKHSLYDWQIVHENVKSYLRRGRGTLGILETLALSYDDLPVYLKPCFLYLSVFPEDYEIHVDRLIQLWVAEDIVPLEESEGNGEELAEDAAERYINELVERYMVLVGERDASFKIKTCRMHDLIRDLCLSKAKEENFIYIVDGSKMVQAGHVSIPSPAIGKVRRLSMLDSFMLINLIKNRRLRSLFFFHQMDLGELLLILDWPWFVKQLLIWFFKKLDADGTTCDTILLLISFPFVIIFLIHKILGLQRDICKNFKMLRVLNFEGMGCKLIGDFGSLIHLRFLSLGKPGFQLFRFPASIRKLKCLLTLDLRADEYPVHIPNVLWKMERLRHLYLPEKICPTTKLKLDKLRNMQTLVNFNTKNCYLRDVFYMKNLKKLEISTPFIVENFREDSNLDQRIIASKHLRSLRIWSDKNVDPTHLARLLSSCLNICELDLSSEIRTLPRPQHISSNIAYMRLARSQLDEDPIPTLEKLPRLRVLELEGGAFNGTVLACSAQGFPRLDSLSILHQANLEELRLSEGAMPYLRHLMIADCGKLKMLPDELRSISALTGLKIEKMSKAFKEKLVRGGEDFYKVQHVPSVTFKNCDH